MVETISRIFILALGVALVLLTGWGMVIPDKLIKLVQGVMDRPSGMVVAVGVRIVMGLALIITAPVSKYPEVFRIIGGIALVAAVVLPFIGRRRLIALLGWFDGVGPTFMRIWLVLGLIFGGFLFYGII